jgi:hypothetical protein
MAKDDIYKSESKWGKFVKSINTLTEYPKDRRAKYYVKNKANIEYFHKLVEAFEVDDLSFKRRLRLMDLMRFICFHIDVDLAKGMKEHKNKLILAIRKITSSPNQLKQNETEVKQIARRLFEEDKPEIFKDFKIRIDKAQQTARKDKMTYEEFDSIMKFFSNDPTVQGFISITMECLTRPQESCYIRIGNIQLFEQYAKIDITEHGKEGIKRLLCIESYPYLLKLYNEHPKRKDPNSFLFLNKEGNQLTNFAVNKRLKYACKQLKIDKPITPYSLKRFGVTFRRQKGDSDVVIQHIANWTSTKQLKVYDQTSQEDVFNIELAKKGLIKGKENGVDLPKTRQCQFCGEIIGFADSICNKCKRLTDPEEIKKHVNQEQRNMEKLREAIEILSENIALEKKEKLRGLFV